MKFAHTVKHNGVVYAPGEEVPIGVNAIDMIDANAAIKKEVKLDVTEREAQLLEKPNKELIAMLNQYGVDRAINTRKVDLVQEIVDIETKGLPEVHNEVEQVEEQEQFVSDAPTVDITDAEGGAFLTDIVNE